MNGRRQQQANRKALRASERRRESLWVVSDGEAKLLEAAEENPNAFLNYYLRTDGTGTLWLPGARNEKWRDGYEVLRGVWESTGRDGEFTWGGGVYRVIWDHEKSGEYVGLPAFFHNHGSLMLPYQVDLFKDRTPVRVVMGGFGSGKTLGLAQSVLVRLATIPSYRAFVLAPLKLQAAEFYKLMMGLIAGTEYERRFLINASESGLRIVAGNSKVGENTVEFFPVIRGENKLRTLTGDEAIIDQAENPYYDLKSLLATLATRFRGRVRDSGRLGLITLLANADENATLWDLVDESLERPEEILSIFPSSYDNPYLTDADIKRFESALGSKEQIAQYMLGVRPLGSGAHFTRAMIEGMRDKSLDDELEERGGTKIEGNKAGVVEFLIPPVAGREYVVISDPGTANPPFRDTGVIMVWDVTDFPGAANERKAARMVGFVWVYGQGDIKNWANRYAEMVARYGAVLRNGFDSTGFQGGYAEWLSVLSGLMPEPFVLTGNNKYKMVNSAKILVSHGLLKAPHCLLPLYEQMSRYDYPEPKGLRQDIVITLFMSAWWLQRLFYRQDGDIVGELVSGDFDLSRYSRNEGAGRWGSLGRRN